MPKRNCRVGSSDFALDLDTLHRVKDEAMTAADRARLPADGRASDGGQRARAYERLADAADALHALLLRDAAYVQQSQLRIGGCGNES